jgi:membrane protein YqaA with SNARE-associated domain
VKLLGLTLGFGMISAIIPVFNMEAFIAVAYAQSSHHPLLLSFVGSLGQNIGKLVWFYVSKGALDIPWLKKRIDTPKRQAQYEKWSGYVQGRPAMSGVLTFVSAAVGFPPFFAMAMIAGTLRMNAAVFFFAGLVGRTLFFWVLLTGVGLVFT